MSTEVLVKVLNTPYSYEGLQFCVHIVPLMSLHSAAVDGDYRTGWVSTIGCAIVKR